MMVPRPHFLILSFSLAALAFYSPADSSPHSHNESNLVVHEWGTFTSVAGQGGEAVRWHPRSGPDNLPSFVEHFGPPSSKRAVLGTIRMETPVLYFYSSVRTTVSVNVQFASGVITEWFPHAHVEPNPRHMLGDMALYRHPMDGAITWDSVTVDPSLTSRFPTDDSGSQYYAARKTSAAPVTVNDTAGDTEQEKFLFYRGVSAFEVPVVAHATQDGGVEIRNRNRDEIPRVILFERRGNKMGYRLGDAVQSEAALDRPELTATPKSLRHDLEEVLKAQGLYPDEAHAMVETWRDSWFEEGSRLFYIVPADYLNRILPLSISPAPSQTLRVFVGRIELITPATERAVLDALANHDSSVIGTTYGRFLEPILEQLRAENPAGAPELEKELTDTYNTPPKPR